MNCRPIRLRSRPKSNCRACPRTWLGVGDADPLLSDSLEFAAKLRDAGVKHTLKRYPGLPHAFVMMSRLYKGADAALDDAAAAAEGFVER
jgi:acetyl esterase